MYFQGQKKNGQSRKSVLRGDTTQTERVSNGYSIMKEAVER